MGWPWPTEPELWICWWAGTRLLKVPLGPGTRFEYIKSVNRIGQFNLELPYQLDLGFARTDFLVQFWRSPGGVAPRFLDFLGWIRYVKQYRRDDGSIGTILKGHDPNGLLARRIVAYDSDDTKTYADNDPDVIIYNLYADNFTSTATDTNRDLAKIRGLSWPHAADIAQAGLPWRTFTPDNVQMKYAWWPVHEVMQKVWEIAYTNDTTTNKDQVPYYGIRVHGVDASDFQRPKLRFEIKYGQWGLDRTWEAGNPFSIIFNHANGNLINEFYEEDHRNEANVIYAGGPGSGSSRTVSQVIDYERVGESGWARAEGWTDARQQSTANEIASAGYAKLAEMRPRVIAGGDLIDSDYARYGMDWYHGDKVTIEIFKKRYEGVIMNTQLVHQDGEETITARVIHQST